MITKIEYLGWVELFKEYSKKYFHYSCVFITLNDEVFDEDSCRRVSKELGEGGNIFIQDYILLLFDDEKEAVEWTNNHDEAEWPFYAICIRNGETLTENT